MSKDPGIEAATRETGVNLSQVSKAALRRAASAARDVASQEENRAWADTLREWAETIELPLERYWMF